MCTDYREKKLTADYTPCGGLKEEMALVPTGSHRALSCVAWRRRRAGSWGLAAAGGGPERQDLQT